MASSLPPVKNAAFTFDLALVSQADTDVFQTSVTLAAGDIQVSKDGGAFANITTLPTEIGTSGVLPVALSATEMNADRVTVRCHDAAGDEWQDALVTIYTAAQTLDTTDGVADAVKAKTDNLPAAPAATGDIPSAASNATAVRSELTTELGRVDVAVSSRAAAATALSNAMWTDVKAGYLTGAVALEATLTAMKGAGWTTETLAAIDALIDTIKAKTDNLPASPAATGAAMTLTAAYDAAKTAASQTSVNDLPTNSELAAALAAADDAVLAALAALNNLSSADAQAAAAAALAAYGAALEATAQAIKAKTDNLPSDPAATGDIPSAGTVADAVHDEMLAGHLTPGSAGAALAGAGGAADPLANPVPGAYAEGTAGAALGRVDVAVSSRLASTGAGSVTLVSPVSSAGDVEIYQGDDYHSGDGRALEWTNTAGTWPDLTGATVTFAVRAPNGSLFSTTGTVVTPTGSQVVRVELTAAQTALLLDWPVGSDMRLRATLANGRKATLLRGELAAVADIMTVES